MKTTVLALQLLHLQDMDLPVNLPLCAAGLLANLLCIAVLTRRNMRTPLNRLLLYLAVTDALGLAFYLASMLALDAKNMHCKTLSCFFLYVTLDMISTFLIDYVNMWLTISITIIRYLAISQMTFRLSLTQTKYVFLFVIFIALVHKTPSFALAVIDRLDLTDKPSDYYYAHGITDRIVKNNGSYVNYAMDMVACLLLAIFSCLIICVIYKGAKRHKKITNRNAAQGNVWKQTTRTTLTILAMTLATSLCKFVVVFNNICFLHFEYRLGFVTSGPCYIMDYLVPFKKSLHMVNSGMNIVFFIVSKEFRGTLKSLVCCCQKEISSSFRTPNQKS